MARLRFVGRSGRKLKEKRQLSKNIKNIPPKNAKLKLLKNVHNGINEFCKIADGDSDEVGAWFLCSRVFSSNLSNFQFINNKINFSG